MPIGSDYQPDTMELFAGQAVEHDTNGVVRILVLPITYSRNAYTTSNGERQQNLTLAQRRTDLMQDACETVRHPDQTCAAVLVPVLVRSDADLQSNLAYFDGDVDGMFSLGGDQTVAMQVVADTEMEGRMAAAYAGGAPFGGNSAGDAIQSVEMINGYTAGNDVPESMEKGAVDLGQRGLAFGIASAVMDQHVFEYGRTGRSLNVAMETGLPVIGMDAATGAVLTDETTLADVTGDTSGYVVDPLTWHATAAWRGANLTLSARGVALSLLAPGGDGYDLAAMRPTHDGTAYPAPSIAGRTYPAFATGGAATLLLSGGIAGSPGGPVVDRFRTLAGGAGARIVVLATGYAKSEDAKHDAKVIADAMTPASVSWYVLDAKTDDAAVAKAVASATGVLLTAPDRSMVRAALDAHSPVVSAVHGAWMTGGAVLLADNAAAAVLGGTYIADPISADVEASAPLDLLPGGVAPASGLSWVTGLNVEPRLLPDQNWAQLLELVAADQGTPAAGIDQGTALEVAGGQGAVVGDSAAVMIDGRSAHIGTGSNGSLSARWLVVDSFADGDTLAP